MKFLKFATNIVVSLFLFDFAIAKDDRTLNTAEIARVLGMPELNNASAHFDLDWFRNHLPIGNEKAFFLGALTSELENSQSFPHDRTTLAKICLKAYYQLSEAEQGQINLESLKNCVKILAENNDFLPLIDLTINFGPKVVTFLNELDMESVKHFTHALFESPRKDEFFSVINSAEGINVFNIRLYGQMIASPDISEENYSEFLMLHRNLALAGGGAALAMCLEKLPFNFSSIAKVERFFESFRDPDVQEFVKSIKDSIRIVMAPDDVTSARLGVNTADLPINLKISQSMNALNHGKDALLRETLTYLSDIEKLALLKMTLSLAKGMKPSELKAASKLYGMISEEARRPIHESQEYLIAAVQYLRLERMQILPEGDHKFSLTFRASPEQVALGYFEEMTYFARREGGPSFDMFFSLGLDIKFTSAEAVEAFVSQDMQSIFPQWTDNSLTISKDTLRLIAGSGILRDRMAELGYKIMMKESEVIEFLKETALEDVPIINNLIHETFVTFSMLSSIKEPDTFSKLEKFISAKMTDIVKNVLTFFDGTAFNHVLVYCKIRNALLYCIHSPELHRLNELPRDLKMLLVREFPNLRDSLAIA